MSTPNTRSSLTAALGTPRPPADVAAAFDACEAAAEFAPLPRGTYEAVAEAGELTTSRNHLPGYRVTFRITAGEHAGRPLWRTWFLTKAALTYTKRDLAKFGLTTYEQLQQPALDGRHVVRLGVVLKTEDDGRTFNDIRTVEVIEVRTPEADPFAPEAGGDR